VLLNLVHYPVFKNTKTEYNVSDTGKVYTVR